MPRIVAALFEDQAAAQRALQAMLGTGVARDRIAITGGSDGREVSSISGFQISASCTESTTLRPSSGVIW